MKRLLYTLSLIIPLSLVAQDVTIKEGIPSDLENAKLIILKHEKINVEADKKGGRAEKYLYLRQTNHNNVTAESNDKLTGAAMEYPYQYALSTRTAYKYLLKAGYKYVLDSQAYEYDNLYKQPNEGELIIYEYFIRDIENNIAYKVFELDEMKIYDSKLLIKKLNKAIQKAKK